jgi:hypothetical protein
LKISPLLKAFGFYALARPFNLGLGEVNPIDNHALTCEPQAYPTVATPNIQKAPSWFVEKRFHLPQISPPYRPGEKPIIRPDFVLKRSTRIPPILLSSLNTHDFFHLQVS